MKTYFRYCLILLVNEILLLTWGQTLMGTVFNIEPSGDPQFINVTCTPDPKKTPCYVEFYDSVTCDMMVDWKATAIDRSGKETVIQEDVDTAGNCLGKAKGTIMYHTLDVMRQCFKLSNLCPFSGVSIMDDCRFDTGVSAIPFSNKFSAIIKFSKEGKEKWTLKFKVEIDDKETLQSVRQTQGQKQRRRPKNKNSPANRA